MVVQVEMKSQKVEEGAKSVFYLPVMSSFIAGFPVYRGASQGIFGKNATGIRNWYLLRAGAVGTNTLQRTGSGWGPPGMHYLLPVDESRGEKNPIAGPFEELLWLRGSSWTGFLLEALQAR